LVAEAGLIGKGDVDFVASEVGILLERVRYFRRRGASPRVCGYFRALSEDGLLLGDELARLSYVEQLGACYLGVLAEGRGRAYLDGTCASVFLLELARLSGVVVDYEREFAGEYPEGVRLPVRGAGDAVFDKREWFALALKSFGECGVRFLSRDGGRFVEIVFQPDVTSPVRVSFNGAVVYADIVWELAEDALLVRREVEKEFSKGRALPRFGKGFYEAAGRLMKGVVVSVEKLAKFQDEAFERALRICEGL